jgi:23S rRNA pseudouridine2457 synthase
LYSRWMPPIVLFNKPYGVLCQFSAQAGRKTLKDFLSQPDIYPAGRLDADSEGLVVLTSDGPLQHRISDPANKMPKTYLVQVEGVATEAALDQLRSGIALGDFMSREAKARAIDEPTWLWLRTPPVRVRRFIPTSWIEVTLREGKNRQIRRMTAAVGLPTLRLIRYAVGDWTLEGIDPGHWRELAIEVPYSGGIQNVALKRQPFRARHVIGRAIPHPLKRKKP